MLAVRARRLVVIVLALLIAAVTAAPAEGSAGDAAAPASRLYGTGGVVQVEILEAESDFNSRIVLVKPHRRHIGFDDATGRVVSLGRVPAALELVFAIEVLETGDTFFTGPPSRNPDGTVHALIEPNRDGTYTVRVGFEDLLGGGDADFNDVLFRVSGVAQRLVELDVKPGSATNPVNTRSRGVLPVAVLAAPGQESRVDVSTLCFGPVLGPARGDCSEKHQRGHMSDVNGDGLKDVVLHFDVQEARLTTTDKLGCLVGRTARGVAFVGCDAVKTR